ncbi:MAG: CRISPR system precrRNA processing endoribonuclease RAMP protein Cas6 [Candidatus Caldarchaeum sp.]|nr:CRISPR system precrRNA processing endoribonuclease RAMP protein Cas6 [Candidatus Caldarchaeum sp.]
MVVSFLFRAVSPNPIEMDVFSGFYVRGIFFSLLKSVDPELATAVHEERTLSPYSTSPLENTQGRKIFYGTVPPGSFFQFRITTLRNSVSDALARCLTGGSPPSIQVNGVHARVSEVYVEHYDGGEHRVLGEPCRYDVVFRTPTFFRNTQKGPNVLQLLLPRRLRRKVKPVYRYVIVPDPYHFFRNLARLYRQFCKPNFPYRSYSEWLLEGGVALETYDSLKVYKVYDSDGTWSRGFVGRAVFSVPKDLYDGRMAKITGELLEFARFSNVGGNRTAGFGVIDYRVADSRESG